jgi:hypothetical protein
VSTDSLIANKSYFFSYDQSKPYNQHLLKAILEKNIDLDHETIVDANIRRLIRRRYVEMAGAW